MFNLRFSLRTSKACLIFVPDKRQCCHNNKLTNVKIMESVKKETLEISKEQFGNLWMLHLQVNDLIKLDLNIENFANLPEGWGRQLFKIVQTSTKIDSEKI